MSPSLGQALAAVLSTVLTVAACAQPGDVVAPDPAMAPSVAATPQVDPPHWEPRVGESFYIQYNSDIDFTRQVDVYNLDGERTTAAQVKLLRDRGVVSVCYVNAGAFEDWRADKGTFPAEVIGEPLDGWPGENWLDIRRLDVLIPIMSARIQKCADKGFVAVDPDNTDGWQQDTGFPIKPADQIAYQRALAAEAHKRGLAIGLKNNPEQLEQLAPIVDFAVNEQCVELEECDRYRSFLASGKPVYTVEYRGNIADICRKIPPGMSVIRKDRGLSKGGQTC